MADLQYVLAKLDDTPESELSKLSKKSRVPKGTISKIKYRVTKNPGVLTVQQLEDHFRVLDGTAPAPRRKSRRANGHAARL